VRADNEVHLPLWNASRAQSIARRHDPENLTVRAAIVLNTGT